MKKIIYKTLGFLAAGVMAAGCIQETFPEGGTQVLSQVQESAFALKGMLNGLPASMNSSNTMAYLSRYNDHTDCGIGKIHLNTEFMLNDLATLGDNPFYNRFYSECYNQGQGDKYISCAYYWEAYYTWIKIANDVILVVNPETASKEQLQYLGQALAYRAAFYLDLARLFEAKPVTDPYAISKGYKVGDQLLGLTVPIVTPNMSELVATNNPRAKREDMYKFILEDLDRAEEYLAGSAFDYKVPSAAAVWGLKARAYLEMGYWNDGNESEYFDQAATYARKVIDESGRKPLTKEQWQDPTNGFNNGTANSAWVWGQTSSSENLSNLNAFTAHIASEATWGYAPLSSIGIDRRLYESIPASDWRKASWLDPAFIKNPESEDFKNYYKFAGDEEDKKIFIYGSTALGVPPARPYLNIKFRPMGGETADYKTGNAADHCLMRVEEMYFIEAEAVAHKDLGQGKALLESFVKSRDSKYTAMASSLENFLVDDLLHQKRIEFWGEGILFYDFKRLDAGFTRGYDGTNHAAVYALNCTGRSPQWNIVITRGEFQSNKAITDQTNNPDPSDKVELWVKK